MQCFFLSTNGLSALQFFMSQGLTAIKHSRKCRGKANISPVTFSSAEIWQISVHSAKITSRYLPSLLQRRGNPEKKASTMLTWFWSFPCFHCPTQHVNVSMHLPLLSRLSPVVCYLSIWQYLAVGGRGHMANAVSFSPLMCLTTAGFQIKLSKTKHFHPFPRYSGIPTISHETRPKLFMDFTKVQKFQRWANLQDRNSPPWHPNNEPKCYQYSNCVLSTLHWQVVDKPKRPMSSSKIKVSNASGIKLSWPR